MKIQIIIGSVRLGRIGPELAKWIKNALEENAVEAESEIIDLKEWPLPMDDEPGLPALGHYDQPHTKAWSDKIAQGDMVIFLTPQYNWGYPASLKNAIDHLYTEWANKPALIVSYANRGGGKAAAQLKQVLDGIHMQTQEDAIEIKLSECVFDEAGAITDEDEPLSAYRQLLITSVKRMITKAY